MMNLPDIFEKQRAFFLSGKTRELDFRVRSLKKLSECITRSKDQILQALHTDLNKSDIEGEMTEISVLQEEIRYVSQRLHKWTGTSLPGLPWHFCRQGVTESVNLTELS